MGFIFMWGFILYMLAVFLITRIILAAPGLIVATIIYFLTRKKLITKDKSFRELTYVLIFIICGYISTQLTAPVLLAEKEKPSDLYIKMQKINDTQRLVGLSKEQVIILLGEPWGDTNENEYYYRAGTISKGPVLEFPSWVTEEEYYALIVRFDENGRVTSTNMHRSIP